MVGTLVGGVCVQHHGVILIRPLAINTWLGHLLGV